MTGIGYQLSNNNEEKWKRGSRFLKRRGFRDVFIRIRNKDTNI